MTTPIRVLIVDDAKCIRTFLRKCLQELKVEVVGEASNGEEAVKMQAALKPDILLLDINMPVLDGQDALKRIIAADPNAHVVMLTSQTSGSVVEECIEAGAMNYILKDMPKEALLAELQGTFAECQKPH